MSKHFERGFTYPLYCVATKCQNSYLTKYCNKIIFNYVNSIIGLSFNFFFWNKVLVGPVNSAWDPLEKHNPM